MPLSLDSDMAGSELSVRGLVSAVEQPLDNLHVWLAGSDDNASVRLETALKDVGAVDDDINLLTARLVLGWGSSQLSVKGIAEQFGIHSSAVSQRKSRIEGVLDELFNDPDVLVDPLVELWKERASRCVRVDELPSWMAGFLVVGDDSRPWGVPEDIFWVLLHSIMQQPRVIADGEGGRWLVDLALDTRHDNKGRFRSLLDSIADLLSPRRSVVISSTDFEQRLATAGVSRLSLESFSRELGMAARRTVTVEDRVLVLSDADTKNLGQIIKRVMEMLDVERSAIPALIAAQHERNEKSVANELRRL